MTVAVVETGAFPRAGLLGNPSDLYGGRGIGFTFADFRVRLVLEPAAQTRLELDLIDAAWRAFAERKRPNAPAPFAVRVESDIPRQAGLAGSSAIVIAALRAFARWCQSPLPEPELAELAWRVENELLGIRAGPMDRLVQAHEGLVAMDFAAPFAPGSVQRLDPRLLPPLLLAIDPEPGQPSGQVHAPVWERWRNGDPEVRAVVAEYRPLVERGLAALRERDLDTLLRCVDRNFDLRARLFTIGARDRQMIEIGRGLGAATKFCGSGGAVLVAARARAALAELSAHYARAGFTTLEPRVCGGEPCT